MTYRTLLEELSKSSAEQLDQTATVFDPYSKEFTAVVDFDIAKDKTNDVLDDGHFYLVLKA